jgi:hypothetical protein
MTFGADRAANYLGLILSPRAEDRASVPAAGRDAASTIT